MGTGTEIEQTGRVGRGFARVTDAITGPRGRWATIGVWVVLAAVGVVLHGRLDQVTSAGQASFLPAHSQSTKVVAVLKSKFHGGENIPLFVVFERRTGADALRPTGDRQDRRAATASRARRSDSGVRPADDDRQGPAAARSRSDLTRRSGGDHRPRCRCRAPPRGVRCGHPDPQAAAHGDATGVGRYTSPVRPGSPPTLRRSPPRPARRC